MGFCALEGKGEQPYLYVGGGGGERERMRRGQTEKEGRERDRAVIRPVCIGDGLVKLGSSSSYWAEGVLYFFFFFFSFG